MAAMLIDVMYGYGWLFVFAIATILVFVIYVLIGD